MVSAWVLNLDAELELAAGGGYQPTRATRAQVERHEARARAILQSGDVLLHEGDRLPEELRGVHGRAWCMTPRALRILKDAGAAPIPSPGVQVLRAVNHRSFCARLGQTLPDACWVTDRGELDRALARAGDGARCRLKRPLVAAGRGQRRVRAGRLESADVAWVEASLRQDGLQVEPDVDVLLEMTVHGQIFEDGAPRIGEPTVQECDARGQWRCSRPPRSGELHPDEEGRLRVEASRVAGALRDAGYFGPFGLDAYRYAGSDGIARLNIRSEINARYTMGWNLGSGGGAG